MTTFFVTLFVFGIALLAMAVGVLTGKTRIQGSCGGIGGRCEGNGEPSCDLCTVKNPVGESAG